MNTSDDNVAVISYNLWQQNSCMTNRKTRPIVREMSIYIHQENPVAAKWHRKRNEIK